MTRYRFVRYSLLTFAMIVLTTCTDRVFATDPSQPIEPSAIQRSPHRVRKHAASTESESARQKREHLEDLERRVERLEQRYEMTPPTLPPSDSTR